MAKKERSTAMNRNIALIIFLVLTIVGCASAQTQAPVVAVPVAYSAPTVQHLSCGTYNNTKPGGSQAWAGVDAVELRPNLKKNGAQLWLHEDGRWDGQGGKFSLLFPNQQALNAYCANPHPSPSELKVMAGREPLCASSVGKGQKWLPF
jgi:hypothetical protein